MHNIGRRIGIAIGTLTCSLALACGDERPNTPANSGGGPIARGGAWGLGSLDGFDVGDSHPNGGAPGRIFSGSSSGSAQGGSGGTGAGGGGPELLEVSLICGDGVLDTDVEAEEPEECDDGEGANADLCTQFCQVADTAVVPLPAVVPAPPDLKGRYLGEGRHPAAGSSHSFGVAFVEPDEEPPVIGLSVFDPAGDPRSRLVLSDGTTPVLFANPVIAALADGSYAAAWTEFGGDGDELGIALRRVTPAAVPNNGEDPPEVGAELGAALSPVQFANSEAPFSQFDADIVALDTTFVAAWADSTNPATAPDLKYRIFQAGGGSGTAFVPVSSDRVLWASDDVEGNVALARFGSSFAAAWRSGRADGTETIEVFAAQGGVRWSVSVQIAGHMAGPAEDRPALAEIDATHLLLVYTDGTDPLGTTVANVGRLRAAVLDTEDPDAVSVFSLAPQHPDYLDPALSQSHPSLERVGDRWFVGWRSAALVGNANAEDLWLAELTPVIEGDEVDLEVQAEHRMPRFAQGSLGDQRFGALAAVPELLGTQGLPGPAPNGGLLVAWDDYGQTLGPAQGKPDVLAAFYPAPGVRRVEHPDCTIAQPCGTGDGDCDSNDDCQPGLVCAIGIGAGPKHGRGIDVDVCVPPHCANGIQDADEEGVDCGGADCGACLCGDGIEFPLTGEECDDAGDSNVCDFDCTDAICGDTYPNAEAGEDCDDGNTINTDACVEGCQDASCGDGFAYTGVEQCDDGNMINTDACLTSCQNASCGDGFVRTGVEQCDGPGNTPTCDADCTSVTCGDGFVNPAAGEICEPSQVSNCSNCSSLVSCSSNPANCGLVIEHKGGTQPSDNHINAQIRIRNQTAVAQPISELKLRYYFTRHENTATCPAITLSTPCDVPSSGTPGVCSNVTFTVNNVSPALNQVDTYVEATLTGSDVIQPNAFRELNFRIHWNAWTPDLIETNDYSYRQNSVHELNTKITLYKNGQRVWGDEPSGVACGNGGAPTGCEQCDPGTPGGETALCDFDCTSPTCGDGHVNPLAGEWCEASIPVSECSGHCGQSCSAPVPVNGCTSCTGFSTTSGCADGRVCLKVQYKPDTTQFPVNTTDQHIRASFKIVNNGFTPVPLSQVKIRYYFTRDAVSTMTTACESGGCTVTLGPSPQTTISYFDVSFPAGSPTLAPCQSSSIIRARVSRSSGTANFNEGNDYSYFNTSSLVDRTQITLLKGTQVFWGTPGP